MSIRGIDAQIMINRVADAAPEQSRVQRLQDVAQNQFANMLKHQIEEDANRPTAAAKAEKAGIRNEERGTGENAGGGKKKRRKDSEDKSAVSPEEADMGMVTPSHIDIKV